MKEVEINGEVYVKKSTITVNKGGRPEKWITKNKKGKTMCIVRTYSAGVFYGWVDYENADGFNLEIFDVVRIWYWKGAFTLSQVAMEGVNEPQNCKFSIEVPVIKINRWIELIPMTEKAIISLNKVTRKRYED